MELEHSKGRTRNGSGNKLDRVNTFAVGRPGDHLNGNQILKIVQAMMEWGCLVTEIAMNEFLVDTSPMTDPFL